MSSRDAVLFNTDSFDLSAIPTHSDIVRILMVRNTSSHRTIAYQWKNYDLPDTLRVNILPTRGILRSKTIQSVRVEINTKGHPCEINVDISCEFIDLTERRKHKRDILKHEILQKELEGQFTITDERLVTPVQPKAKVKLSKKPVKFNKVFSIRCRIINFLEEDSEMRSSEYLRNSPSNEIYLENESCVGSIPRQKLMLSVSILENITWSISNGKTLGNIFGPRINVTYPQFLSTVANGNNFSQKLYTIPRKKLVASVLEKMLFVITHQEFALDTVHLVDQPDVRHISYLKRLPPTHHGANYVMRDFVRGNPTRGVSFRE